MSAKTILIVEDDPVLLRGLKDNFEAQGYVVRTAKDGQKGLDALLTAPPDLLLLDLMLPKVNGYEICQHRPRPPVGHAHHHAHRQGAGGRHRPRPGAGRR